MNASVLVYLTVFLYLIAGFSIGLRLFSHSEPPRPARALGIGLGIGAIALHGILLFGQLLSGDSINLSFFSAGSLTAWAIAVILLVSALSKPVENLGALAFPIAAVVVILASRFPGERLLEAGAAVELHLHVITSMLAYALLTLASAQALLVAVQDNHLRSHHPGGFVRALPPLQTMEALLFELIGVGFVLLSIALLTGFVYLDDMFAQNVAHKTILSILAWIAFAVLLWGRFRFGWRGRTAIQWTLGGFAALMLAYFGSKAILELVLHR